jgi:hypothetical protein
MLLKNINSYIKMNGNARKSQPDCAHVVDEFQGSIAAQCSRQDGQRRNQM